MTVTLPKNVERGAELLDRELPGWDERIDLDRLDLGSTCDCIVGQLNPAHAHFKHHRYSKGIEALGVETRPSRFGFNTWGQQRFASLTAAWKRLIESRRKEEG